MPDISIWPLFLVFVAGALAAIFKMVEAVRALKLADDECTRLRAQLDVLNNPVNKTPLENLEVNIALAPPREDGDDKNASQGRADIFHSVLALVAEFHSQGIEATPRLIAERVGLEPGVALAYMQKFHEDQFITFANGGANPGTDTPFFLSPNAWKHIKIVPA
jgi:hypothetical protein